MKPNDTPLFYVGRIEPGGYLFDAWLDRPLLQSIEEGGLSWPSSCRAGRCRSCVVELVSGMVRHEVESAALTAEEQAAGLILPCVAYPRSDVVLQQAVDGTAFLASL